VSAQPTRESSLEAALGIELDPSFLQLALTHRSFAFEAGGLPTNERLEFLGDAVLGLVVADLLYREYPAEPEGRLAKFRAAAVNTLSLADVGRRLDLGTHVRLGRGEEQSGGRDKDSILADTVEALIGAAYLDAGMAAAADLVSRLFRDLLREIATSRESLDYKTSLQELTAAGQAGLPRYEVSESGPDHQKRFAATVTIGGTVLGRGEGRNKKEAEQRAAAEAFAHLRTRSAAS
jgi:ribonuclease-3